MATSIPAQTLSLLEDGDALGSCLVADASKIPAGTMLSVSSNTIGPRACLVASKKGSSLTLVNPQSGVPADMQLYRVADDAMVTVGAQTLVATTGGVVPAPTVVQTGTDSDTCGTSTLVGGTVVVATKAVTANSIIVYSRTTLGGTAGHIAISARTAGTSFTLLSASGTETSTVSWLIIN